MQEETARKRSGQMHEQRLLLCLQHQTCDACTLLNSVSGNESTPEEQNRGTTTVLPRDRNHRRGHSLELKETSKWKQQAIAVAQAA